MASDKFQEAIGLLLMHEIKSFPPTPNETKGFFQFPLYQALASTEKIIKMSSHRSKVKTEETN